MTKSARRRGKVRKALKKSFGPIPGRRQVLGTFELLESILSFLPPLDLLRCQRVCYTMNSTIAQSEILQQKLFLRPQPDDGVVWYQDPSIFTGALFDPPFTVIRTAETAPEQPVNYRGFSSHRRPVVINPLITKLSLSFDSFDEIDSFGCFDSIDRIGSRFSRLAVRVDWRIGIKFRTLHASAIQMFLTQPPIEHISLQCGTQILSRPGGIRVKDVLHRGAPFWDILTREGFAVTAEEKAEVERADEQRRANEKGRA